VRAPAVPPSLDARFRSLALRPPLETVICTTNAQSARVRASIPHFPCTPAHFRHSLRIERGPAVASKAPAGSLNAQSSSQTVINLPHKGR